VKYPRLVLDRLDLYGREKSSPENSTFRIVPGEAFVLEAHKLVHESALFLARGRLCRGFVDKFRRSRGVATCRCKWGGNWGKGLGIEAKEGHHNLPKYAKTLWEVSRDRANFLRNRFVFLLRKIWLAGVLVFEKARETISGFGEKVIVVDGNETRIRN